MNLVISIENKISGDHLHTRTVTSEEIQAHAGQKMADLESGLSVLKQSIVEGTLEEVDFEMASWLAQTFRPEGYMDEIRYNKDVDNIALSYDGPETDMPYCDNLRIDILVDDIA